MRLTEKQLQALKAIEKQLDRTNENRAILSQLPATITRAIVERLAEHQMVTLTPAKPQRTLVSLTLLGKAVLARLTQTPLTAQPQEVAALCTPACHPEASATLTPDGGSLVVVLTFALPEP